MSDFSFEGPQCGRCGAFLDSANADCDECSEEQLRRFHFEHISNEDRIQTVWSINEERAWHDLMERVAEPLPWRCVETGSMSVDMAQKGHDVKSWWEENNAT